MGKSSVTVNLAAALAAASQRVGLLDADVYGHSVPRMLGITRSPTPVENMIMPPEAHGVRAISAGMMKHGNEPIPVRGPILHKLLEQFPRRRLVRVTWMYCCFPGISPAGARDVTGLKGLPHGHATLAAPARRLGGRHGAAQVR